MQGKTCRRLKTNGFKCPWACSGLEALILNPCIRTLGKYAENQQLHEFPHVALLHKGFKNPLHFLPKLGPHCQIMLRYTRGVYTVRIWDSLSSYRGPYSMVCGQDIWHKTQATTLEGSDSR